MAYDEYVALFLKACDQPWRRIRQAQTRLVEDLNAGKLLEIEAATDKVLKTYENATEGK